jgi:hypothetical protein
MKASVHTIAATVITATCCGLALAQGISADATFTTMTVCVMLATWMK